jgi:hypothetical protein
MYDTILFILHSDIIHCIKVKNRIWIQMDCIFSLKGIFLRIMYYMLPMKDKLLEVFGIDVSKGEINVDHDVPQFKHF